MSDSPNRGPQRGRRVGVGDRAVWVKRDHAAEWKRWTASLEHIARRAAAIDGVTTSIVQPAGLSNRTPSLRVIWDRQRFGLTGDGVARTPLFDTEPRIALFAARARVTRGLGCA